MKAYLEISAEKELPNKWMKDEHGDEYEVVLCSSLKPFSIPELMEEQLDWIDKNYFKVDQNSYVLKYSNQPFGEAKRYTYKELVNEFLTQKGIIEESGPDWDALKDFPNKAF